MKLHNKLEYRLTEELLERLRSRQLPDSYVEPFEAKAAERRVRRAVAPTAVSGLEELTAGDFHLETIVRAFNRPSILVQNNSFEAVESEVWSDVLETHRASIEASLPSVGRIEFKNHPSLSWGGTGFLVASDIIATNRHVALHVIENDGEGFTWKTNSRGRVMGGRIDFREEFSLPFEEEFVIREILHVEAKGGPDLALLRIDAGDLPVTPLTLQANVQEERAVATIGYPWEDSRISAELEEVMKRIFDDIYDVKRFGPGKVVKVTTSRVDHDCTTLGGNSGSAVVDIETGAVIALHYGGDLDANVAVPAAVLEDRLAKV